MSARSGMRVFKPDGGDFAQISPFLEGGTIRVRESWDPSEGLIAPKTHTFQRTTPGPSLLRTLLDGYRLDRGSQKARGLVFAADEGYPLHAARSVSAC
jgi:hypothetical protein